MSNIIDIAPVGLEDTPKEYQESQLDVSTVLAQRLKDENIVGGPLEKIYNIDLIGEQKKASELELKQLEEPTPQQIQAKQRTDLINQRALNEQAGGAPQVNIVNNSTDNRTNQQNVQSNSHPVMDNDPLLKSLVGVPI